MANAYSSELLEAVTVVPSPTPQHPAGPAQPWNSGHVSQEQPDLSEGMAILGQGGSWEDAGEVRVGREGGGFSAHDYVS